MQHKVLLKTPHFQVDLHLREYLDKSQELYVVHFHIGEEHSRQFSGAMYLKNYYKDEVHLNRSDIVHQSALDDIKYGYSTTERIGTEVIEAFLDYVREKYPTLRTLEIADESYFHCKDDSDDTQDVIVYSIGLYGTTWYEKRLGAYNKSKEEYDTYKAQLEVYTSEETKSKMEWYYMENIIGSSPDYASRKAREHCVFFEECYMNSKTFPEFLRMIVTVIPIHERCQFFRYWLNRLVSMYVDIDRRWYVDIL